MRRRGVWLCLGLIVVTASPSIAQYGLGAQSTLIDSSVRLSGMGRTGAAVFWGGDLNDWSNPAVLAYSRGLRFERSKTQLVPDLANDVFFTTNRLIVGAWGIGVAIAGRPIDALGGDRLDYGVSIATDVDGNELGRFRTLEDENAISLGLSVAQLLRSAGLAAGHRFPAIDRYVDASLGHSWKHVSHWDVGTSTFLGQGDVNKQDRGYLIRVTPYNAIDYPGFIPGLDSITRAYRSQLRSLRAQLRRQHEGQLQQRRIPTGSRGSPSGDRVPRGHRVTEVTRRPLARFPEGLDL